MRIWESDSLTGDWERPNSDGNPSQRPAWAPKAQLRAPNVHVFLLWCTNFANNWWLFAYLLTPLPSIWGLQRQRSCRTHLCLLSAYLAHSLTHRRDSDERMQEGRNKTGLVGQRGMKWYKQAWLASRWGCLVISIKAAFKLVSFHSQGSQRSTWCVNRSLPTKETLSELTH